jgi:small subunit ribosomal protein S9
MARTQTTQKRTTRRTTRTSSTKKQYIYAVGRRKESTAILKLYPRGKGKININTENLQNVDLETLFKGNKYLIEDALYPFYIIGQDYLKQFDADIVVRGGGIRGQAEAIRLAFARALVEYNPEFRTQLKPYGLLKRDPREKERKKYGLKKARRAPQWSKR